MLLLNFGEWTFWEAYDPDNGTFGNQKVTFDGPNKLILVNEPETEIDVATDIYAAWKMWTLHRDNSKYLEAIRVVGGDTINDTTSLGATFFLRNGWRIRTWEGDHVLNVIGNIYTDEGDPVFVSTIDRWNISVTLTVSSLIDQITGEITDAQGNSIAEKVWEYDMSNVAEDQLARGMIKYLRDNAMTVKDFLALND